MNTIKEIASNLEQIRSEYGDGADAIFMAATVARLCDAIEAGAEKIRGALVATRQN